MTASEPITLKHIAKKFETGEPIVVVTAYDFASARAAERAGVDMVLVGDSAAQVVLGYPNTQAVSVDEMLMLTAAVRRATRHALVVSDLPFGSIELSDEQAVATAIRFVREGGADAVKIEGGNEMKISRIRAIVAAGIPVMGHVGLTPQTATALGGLRAQGRNETSARQVADDAVKVSRSGVFAMVIEAVPTEVVDAILPTLTVPVIGIGAGPANGQVLVHHDLLGITEGSLPKFVRTFATVGDEMARGITEYAAAVREGTFPAEEHMYHANESAAQAARTQAQHSSEH